MRRPAVRLASCALAGALAVLAMAPAASADPPAVPGQTLPSTSAAPLNSPVHTDNHGRKL